MTIHSFKFDYTYEAIPEGKRKPRTYTDRKSVTVEVPDLIDVEAPIALVATFPDAYWDQEKDAYLTPTVEYRWYKRKLWTSVDLNNHFKPWSDRYSNNRIDFYSPRTLDEQMEKIESWLSETIYIDGVMWRCHSVEEPVWRVHRLGNYPDSKILLETEHTIWHGNEGWPNYFNANEDTLAYRYAEAKAFCFPDMPAEPIETAGSIYVLIPEAVSFNAYRDVLRPDGSRCGHRHEALNRFTVEGTLGIYYRQLKENFAGRLEVGYRLISSGEYVSETIYQWKASIKDWIKKQPYLSSYDDRLKWIEVGIDGVMQKLAVDPRLTDLISLMIYLFNQCADESLSEKY